MNRTAFIASISLCAIACKPVANDSVAKASTIPPFETSIIADFDDPWAMTFLPEYNQALVTEKSGKLMLWEAEGSVDEVSGVPDVAFGGQGGLGDVILHPQFADNKIVYLSYGEKGAGGAGTAVAQARLGTGANGPALTDLKVIWRQTPKVSGQGHFGQRLAFSPDGKYLFISSGDRQKFDPAQDMNSNLGKIVRLFPDGSTPTDNPFYDAAKPVQSQIWSFGHRNPMGLTFDDKGQLWNHEMGPSGGDELNRVKRGANFGWPKASNGDHYDGGDIPDHKSGDGYEAPALFWNPSISPGGLAFYTGDAFPEWRGSLFMGGLGSQSLLRISFDGAVAQKADQWDMGARIREVEAAPDGSLWLLEDGGGGSQGRMLKLTPKQP